MVQACYVESGREGPGVVGMSNWVTIWDILLDEVMMIEGMEERLE